MNKVFLIILMLVGVTISITAQNQQVTSISANSDNVSTTTDEPILLDFNFVFDESKMQVVANTNISMQAPDFFVVANNFQGFVHDETSSSIQVNQVSNVHYTTITAAMDSAYFAQQGMTLIGKENITLFDNNEAILYTTELKINEKSFVRLVLMSGNNDTTIWINAVYVKALSSKLKDLILKSISTAKII